MHGKLYTATYTSLSSLTRREAAISAPPDIYPTHNPVNYRWQKGISVKGSQQISLCVSQARASLMVCYFTVGVLWVWKASWVNLDIFITGCWRWRRTCFKYFNKMLFKVLHAHCASAQPNTALMKTWKLSASSDYLNRSHASLKKHDSWSVF